MDRNYTARNSILVGLVGKKERITLLQGEPASLLYGNGGRKQMNMKMYDILATYSTKEDGCATIELFAGAAPKVFAWDSENNIRIFVTNTDVIYDIIKLEKGASNENKPLLRYIYIE